MKSVLSKAAQSAFTAAVVVLVAACGDSGPGAAQPPTTVPPGSAEPGGAGKVSGWSDLGTRARSSRADRSAAAAATTDGWSDYDPPAIYSGSVTEHNQKVIVDDGVVISLSVSRPALADGTAESKPLPTIVTFTPYNKNTSDFFSLGGAINPYFVQHGYVHVLVDVRGTGRSGGAWDPFSAREQQDYSQVLDWVAAQPWCNGSIGLWGISATATTAVFAASQGHPAVKALFPIVAHGDIYRDVVFVGGQASVAFLPAWMSVVTLLGAVNPSFYDDPAQYATALGQHLIGLNEFLVPRTVGVLTGAEDSAYDSDYWSAKAPLEVMSGIKVPSFLVGGLFDIFQRSEPLNYEALKGHTTTKLLIGPWHHLQASAGEGLPMGGVPTLDQIALRWFDRYVRNIDNGADRLPAVTQWVWGEEQFVTSPDWPHPEASAQRLFLQAGGALAAQKPTTAAAPATVLQQPVGGVCSESTMQISLGLTAYTQLPCFYEDNLSQRLEVSFDTAPLEQDLYLNGPIQADIWMSTTAADAGLVVRVSDLQPDGTARALSSGIQTASLRAVDESRSRRLDGEMIQPWHPFTSASVLPVGSGNKVLVPVEIFPTSALIKKGHQLRISVGASNFPFAAMPIPGLLDSAVGLLSIYREPEFASSVVLPVVPASALTPLTAP